MNRIVAALLIVVGTIALSPLAAPASDYNDGIALYKQKNYRAAAAKFEKAMAASPRDANLIYYCALSQQLSSNRSRARQLYEYIISNFSNSPVASMAQTGLSQLGGAPSAAGQSSAASGGTSTVTSAGGGQAEPDYLRNLPDEMKVPRLQRGRSKGAYLEVQVNGRPMMFHLDTGAAATMIGANQLQAVGITRPATAQRVQIGGVGDRQDVKGWLDKVDLKIGNIYRRDFPVIVIDEDEGEPLLGQDFLRDFNLTMDDSTILLRKKNARPRAVSRGTFEIPFKVAPDGRHMLVDAYINKKPYVMIFDTGADGCAFSFKDCKNLGIDPPSGAPTGRSIGVKGETSTWTMMVDLKVGKIAKEGFTVGVVDNSDMDHPLLGQSFFGGYKVNVDVPARMIRLTDPDL